VQQFVQLGDTETLLENFLKRTVSICTMLNVLDAIGNCMHAV